MWFFLLACAPPPVIGMEIRAEVTCESPDGCFLSNMVTPCRCNRHHYIDDSGRVEVWDGFLDEEPNVVWSLTYESEFELCGTDGVVADQPDGVGAADGPDPLYAIDVDSSFIDVNESLLVASTPDVLSFEYTADAGELVRETHSVAFRDAMRVVPVPGIPCCGVPTAPAALPLVGALVSVLARRPRPPG